MNEYYSLLGPSCSDLLRSKIDCALKIYSNPSSERYAQISKDWNGICSLHHEDGMCALQMELGESQLPEVCRLYPRNTKQLPDNCECSCSNSCEKVVELLMNIKEPLQFEENNLAFLPEFKSHLSSQRYECCKNSISIIQNRSLSLQERFFSLGNYLNGTDIISKLPDNLYLSFQFIKVLDKYYENNISIGDYCKFSQRYFCFESNHKLSADVLNLITKKYNLVTAHLEFILPDWQIRMEQLLVNHMFYSNFPYSDGKESIGDAFLSLVIMYGFLRLNILGYMSDKTDPSDFIDYQAAMFRMIEHSNFNYVALSLFSMEDYSSQDCIPELIYL